MQRLYKNGSTLRSELFFSDLFRLRNSSKKDYSAVFRHTRAFAIGTENTNIECLKKCKKVKSETRLFQV